MNNFLLFSWKYVGYVWGTLLRNLVASVICSSVEISLWEIKPIVLSYQSFHEGLVSQSVTVMINNLTVVVHISKRENSKSFSTYR